MRPPNHIPCSPAEATVAVLGEATFERKKKAISPWLDPTMDEWFTTDQLTRYGATFYKPVPNPPENTRELTEEELANPYAVDGYLWRTDGIWERSRWAFDVFRSEPWRCRVAIEKKVVAWTAEEAIDPFGWVAHFATKELRDRAVAEANGRES